MATFRPDADETPIIIKSTSPQVADQVQKGVSGTLTPVTGEARAECPKCGSPVLALFDATEPKYNDGIPGFVCKAGDCGYKGSAVRRAK